MAFDLSTASVIEEPKKFDLSTAKVIEESKNNFDLSTAVETDKATIKQDTKFTPTETILRARTADDNQNLDYAKMQELNNGTGGQVKLTTEDIINADRQGLEHSPVIESVVTPSTMLGRGVITKGGLALLEGLTQAKNYLSSSVQGKKYNPFEIENITTAILPEDSSTVLKVIGGLAEMVADGIVVGKLETAAKNNLIKNAVDVFEKRMAKVGYNSEQIKNSSNILKNRIKAREKGLQVENGIGEPEKPMNIDDAVKLNVQARTAQIPKPETESNINRQGAVDVEAEPVRPTEVIEQPVTTKTSEPVKTSESVKPVETAETVIPVETAKVVKPVKVVEPVINKPLNKAEIKDLQNKYNYYTGEFIPYENNIVEKIKPNTKIFLSETNRVLPALYKQEGIYTNGQVMVLDKKVAKELGDKDLENHIKVRAKQLKKENKSLTTEQAVAKAKEDFEETAKSIKIDWKKVIPDSKEVATTGKPVVFFYDNLKWEPVVGFETEKGDKVFVNYNYYSTLQKMLPGCKVYFNNTQAAEKAFVFKNKKGEIKAVVMPMTERKSDYWRIIDRYDESKIKNISLADVKEDGKNIKDIKKGIEQKEDINLADSEENIDNTITEREKQIYDRFNKFLDKETVIVVPHEKLNKIDAEKIFRYNRVVPHNELGDTILSIETINKILQHKGFSTATIIRLLPDLYKKSILIDSPTERLYTKKQHKQHSNIAFWHNTLNKFKIKNDKGEYDEYFIRFTVTEQYAGKKKPKGSIGERTLHSTNISSIDIQKKDGNAANTSNYLGATLPSDNIVADYVKIVNKINKIKNNDNGENLQTDYVRQYPVDETIVASNTTPIESDYLTTVGAVKADVNYKEAKAGDMTAAEKFIDNLFDKPTPTRQKKIEKIKELASKYQDAIIVPMISVEKSGVNKIPLAFAEKISEITGLKVTKNIYQTNQTNHTNLKSSWERMQDKAVFNGYVKPGQKYILVDDVYTSGANLNELRKYIVRQGGNVVAVETVSIGRIKKPFNVDNEALNKLYSLYGKENINGYLRKENIANSAEELTGSQLAYLTGSEFKQIFNQKGSSGLNSGYRRSNQEQQTSGSIYKSGTGEVKSLQSIGNSAGVTGEVYPTDNPSENKNQKLYQALYDLAKKYGVVNISESNYRPKRTTGVFWIHSGGKGNVFVNSLNNLDTVTHEVVHAVDTKNNIISEAYENEKKFHLEPYGSDDVKKQLIQSYKDNYGRTVRGGSMYQAKEGLAMMIQLASINPKFVIKRYPEAFKWAMQIPELADFFRDARQIYVDYESLAPVEKLKSQIFDVPIESVKIKKIPWYVKLDEQIFDSEAVFRWLDEDLYLTSKGVKTILKGIIVNNLTNKSGIMFIFDADGNPVDVSSGFNWRTLITDVDKANSNFNEYLVSRRFVNWYAKRDQLKNNIEKLSSEIESYNQKLELVTGEELRNLQRELTQKTLVLADSKIKFEDLSSIISKHGKDEALMRDAYMTLDNHVNRALAEKYDFLMKCNLDVLRVSGLIDQELYSEMMSNSGYTPFNKARYDELAGDGTKFISKFAKPGTVKNLKKIKGSELPIVSPLYSSVHLMTEAYRKSYMQLINNKLFKIASSGEFPELFQVVPYSQGMENDPHCIVARKANGTRVGIVVDRAVKKVFDSLVNVFVPNTIEMAILWPARFFTKMTTGLYPLYAPVNLVRDQVAAYVNSQTGYIPGLAIIELMVSKNPLVIKYRKEYTDLFGIDNNTFLGSLKDINPADLAEAMRTNKVTYLIDCMQKLLAMPSNITETMTRAAEYIRARMKGDDIKAAKRKADEITGAFGDLGRWGGRLGQLLSKANPYFNSAMQVLRQMFRSMEYSANRNKLLVVSGLLAAAMVGSSVVIMEEFDEEDKRALLQLQAEQLAMYVYISKRDDGLWRIPIDNTYSFFAVLLEMLYLQTKGANYNIKDFTEALTAMLPEQINLIVSAVKVLDRDYSGLQKQFITAIPHLPKMAVALMFGKKTFPTITDIVPKSLQNREPELQYTERTSSVAKVLGKALKISPMKIDYVIDQMFGRTARLGVTSIENIYAGIFGEHKNNDVNNRPPINPFIQQPYFNSGRVVQKFYDDKDKYERVRVTVKRGLRPDTRKQDIAYVNANTAYIKSVNNKLEKHNDLAKYIRDNERTLTEEKIKTLQAKQKFLENMIFNEIMKFNKDN